MTEPAVTVVIANHDHGRFLPEAVASARDQGARVVVVDDGSTDAHTLAVLDELPGEVEVLRQANAGPAAARNRGLARVTTPYVLCLDADDRLAPGALAAMRAALEADPALGYAYGRMEMFGADRGVLRFPPWSAYRLLFRHGIGLSALMRRAVVDDTGGFDPAFRQFEDWELWVAALGHGWRGRQLDRVTLEYRRHVTSKQAADRRGYRATYARMRAKHAALYARAGELARAEGIGPLERLAHEGWWGPRPLPAGVEARLYRVAFRLLARRSSARTSAQ